MGLLDEIKKLAKPYDEDDYDFYEDGDDPDLIDEPTIVAPKREKTERYAASAATETYNSARILYDDEPVRREPPAPAYTPRTVPAAPVAAEEDAELTTVQTTAAVQVAMFRPRYFEQAAGIADQLKAARTVVLSLEFADKDVTRRILDFLSGVAYANSGKIKKVAINTYIITPYDLDITGDLVEELENSGKGF